MSYYSITPPLVATTAVNTGSFVKPDTSGRNACVQSGSGDTAIGVCHPAMNQPPNVFGGSVVAASAGQSVAIYGAGSIVEVRVGTVAVVVGPVKPDANGYAIQASSGDLATAYALVPGAANSFVRMLVLPYGAKAP